MEKKTGVRSKMYFHAKRLYTCESACKIKHPVTQLFLPDAIRKTTLHNVHDKRYCTYMRIEGRKNK